jgi:hypothetical protein
MNKIRGLTLAPPWSWAMVELGKRCENRTWMPAIDLIGTWIAIHGGRTPSSGQRYTEMGEVLDWIIEKSPARSYAFELMHAGVEWERYEGICAVAKLKAVARPGERLPVQFEDQQGWRAYGQAAWLLDEFTWLAKPVSCRGSIGLWDLPDGVLRQVRTEYQKAKLQ